MRWQSGRPLHPQRLHDAVPSLAPGVLRSVGCVWLASRPNAVIDWSSAGDALTLGSRADWPSSDPRPQTRLAFLGYNLNVAALFMALADCVLTDEEFVGGPSSWLRLADPFPDWDRGGGSDQSRGVA